MKKINVSSLILEELVRVRLNEQEDGDFEDYLVTDPETKPEPKPKPSPKL